MSIFEIRSGPPTYRSLMNKSKDRLAHDHLALLAQLDWHPISTAPRDGAHFLAWCKLKEEDQVEYYAVVAYFVFGSFVEFPWRGTFVQNLELTHWMPLPAAPEPRR